MDVTQGQQLKDAIYNRLNTELRSFMNDLMADIVNKIEAPGGPDDILNKILAEEINKAIGAVPAAPPSAPAAPPASAPTAPVQPVAPIQPVGQLAPWVRQAKLRKADGYSPEQILEWLKVQYPELTAQDIAAALNPPAKP